MWKNLGFGSIHHQEESAGLSDQEIRKIKEQKTKESNALKLIICAWVIEICAAGIGFFFAYTTGEATRKYLAQDTEAFIGDPEVSVMLAMLPFMIIGVVELTKIPLAYAAYHAKPSFWKALFIGVLLSLCLITGETIFTGMERSLDNQLKYFAGDKKRQQELIVDVSNLEKMVMTLEQERPIDDIDREYDIEIKNFNQAHYIGLDEINDERQSRLSILENQKSESRNMFINGSSKDEVGNLQNLLDIQLSRINDIEDRLTVEVQSIRQSAQLEIDSKQNQINVFSDSISAITQEFDSGGLFSNNSDKEDQLEAERVARTKAEEELEQIKLKRDQDIANYRDQESIRLVKLEEEKSNIQLKLTDARLKSEEDFNKEQESNNNEINALNSRYDSRQADIQKKYEEERILREKNYQDARFRAEEAQSNLDQTRVEIKNKKEQITDVEQLITSKAGEIQVMRFAATYSAFRQIPEREEELKNLKDSPPVKPNIEELDDLQYESALTSYEEEMINWQTNLKKAEDRLREDIGVEDVTQEDIGFVMLFWFGSIAIIAATTGTVISFASFYIRDPKNWTYSFTDDLKVITPWQKLLRKRRQYYDKKINGEVKPGMLVNLFDSITRLIDAMIKRLTDPKIVKVPGESRVIHRYGDSQKDKMIDENAND